MSRLARSRTRDVRSFVEWQRHRCAIDAVVDRSLVALPRSSARRYDDCDVDDNDCGNMYHLTATPESGNSCASLAQSFGGHIADIAGDVYLSSPASARPWCSLTWGHRRTVRGLPPLRRSWGFVGGTPCAVCVSCVPQTLNVACFSARSLVAETTSWRRPELCAAAFVLARDSCFERCQAQLERHLTATMRTESMGELLAVCQPPYLSL